MEEQQLKGYSPLTAPTKGFVRGDFGTALAHLKAGGRVARRGWNGKGMWLALQVPDEHSKMQQPYIYISPVSLGGGLVPWVASQPDMLANDWESLEG